MRITNHKINELLQITLGVVILALAYYFFLSPANVVLGGVMGTAIIIKDLMNLSPIVVSAFIFSTNFILLIIGGLVLGKAFFFKTIYGTILLPAITALLSLLKIPEDLVIRSLSASNLTLISAVSGGLLSGVGLGLVVKNNATTGGIDVVQKILTNKMKIPFSIAMYVTDGIIILLGIFYFGIESAFFAIIGMILTGLFIDRVIIAGKSGYTVFIVTNNYEAIKQAIYSKINRGVTKVQAVGGFTESEKSMIICTVSKNQIYNLKVILSEIDPKAFSFITKTNETLGQGFK